ncbi:hypothetical protein CRYUN_Cryun02cG0043900 [Craigia yunnanensis]
MKRGKDDEKIVGPMFPRLHVNDTEKGGPRAPPRNKMALYEQPSIPSQKFNPGVLPLNPCNTSSLFPPGSSSQGSSLEKNMLFPSRVSPSTSTTLAEKFHSRQLGGAKTGQQYNKTKNGFDGEKFTPLSPTYPDSQIKLHNVRDKDLTESSYSGVNLRKEDCGQQPASGPSRSPGNDVCSLQELRTGRQSADNGYIDGADWMRDIGEEILPQQRSMSYSEGNHSVPYETNNDSEWHGDKTCGSLQWANGDKSDDVSETSMVDSISGLDISPDDVVGIIGQKHFWKARRAIVK